MMSRLANLTRHSVLCLVVFTVIGCLNQRDTTQTGTNENSNTDSRATDLKDQSDRQPKETKVDFVHLADNGLHVEEGLQTNDDMDTFRPSQREQLINSKPVVRQKKKGLNLPDEWNSVKTFTPHVLLSSEHDATCQRRVGDSLSDLEFLAKDGTSVKLGSMLSNSLTIVVFADVRQSMSREQLMYFEDEFVKPFKPAAIRGIVVNLTDGSEFEFPSSEVQTVRDQGSSSFQKIASGIVPRTYLLNSEGQIIWFDIEYSRDMRFELRNALFHFLKFEFQPSLTRARTEFR